MDFWELYDRHYSRVRAYARSMLRDAAAADDVVQETFLRAQTHVEELREPARVLGWLLRITHNLCMDHLRARQSARIDEAADPELAPAARVGARVQSDLERAEMSACVRDQVDHLAETDRWVILLYDIAGLSHDEIASVLDIEVGAVKVRLHRARKTSRAARHCLLVRARRAERAGLRAEAPGTLRPRLHPPGDDSNLGPKGPMTWSPAGEPRGIE